MQPTGRDTACFEAGIKLGAVYHQFIGTPVTPATAGDLETAMANAMRAQPACLDAAVHINTRAIEADRNRFGYVGLAGHHLELEATISHEEYRVTAELIEEDDYPMMRLVSVEGGDNPS